MQDTAQERDSLKQEVQRLTVQLQERSLISVKKEHAHQGCQTEDTEGQKDYKSLFEKAKQKVNELIKDKEALLAASETRASLNTGRDEEQDIDEISLQVGCLVHELDQTTKERDELRSQVRFTDTSRDLIVSLCPPFCSLIELRHNVGRLLISFVPALDLEQVNYECNVIDEILEQVLNEVDTR
uniref:Uncharacterized protein n=1 Tax=Kryptolebias marmoratus TaxID=37003 RepID=A0A3Q3GN89_KRYMA